MRFAVSFCVWPLRPDRSMLSHNAPPRGDTKKMFSKAKIALAAAIVLSTALTASAATKHHRVTHVPHQAIYNRVPDYNTAPPQSGAPLRTAPDSW